MVFTSALAFAACGPSEDNAARKAGSGPPIAVVVAAVEQSTVPVFSKLTARTDASDSVEIRTRQQLFADTLRDQSRLSNLRYRGGVSSYLEVLDTERQLLDAEQRLFSSQRDEYLAFLQLYKALGGAY